VVKISEQLDEFMNKLFPQLKDKLKSAQINSEASGFVLKIFLLSFIFSLAFLVPLAFVFLKYGILLFLIPLFIFFLISLFFLCLRIPDFNIKRIGIEIENDIFIPSRMLLTLLESGNSIITALVGVSYTKANSSKYFGKIASEIFLGKNIDQAIDDAIKYTPSKSFRRVLEPIKKSLKTGTDIQKNLLSTLNDLSKEKIIEIENYEKKLGPISMFYMIFGTIMPVLGVVGVVMFISLIGLKAEFFPFFAILLVLILLLQYTFFSIFKSIRPLVKL